jgi:hypothetical protein
MSPNEYVVAVVHGLLSDATLTFQLGQGFHVLAVVRTIWRTIQRRWALRR